MLQKLCRQIDTFELVVLQSDIIGRHHMLSFPPPTNWSRLLTKGSVYTRPALRSNVARNRTSGKRYFPYSLKIMTGAFYSEADAEPQERYRKGGYHPTHLGDTLKNGRYKILNKLGWGGYATVWLARDLK